MGFSRTRRRARAPPGFYGWPYCVGNNIPFNDYNFATNTAKLTVRDSGEKTGSVTLSIAVGNTRPKVVFSAPPDGGFIDFGDQVAYTVNVTDPEDGAVDCTKVNVITALGHDQHAHDTGQYTGCSGTVTTTASGHDEAANVYYALSADCHRPRWHPQCLRRVQVAVRELVRRGLVHRQRQGRRAGRRLAPGSTSALRGVGSNRCLNGASQTNGTQVQICACNGQNNQKWTRV
ncbi:RICIN domain-containing protein [Nonomuraea angiospora]|uniref:RICIN domain-containing protein n=1 Tax=Nonomuraea angiospora TaxID=46172 RepID=UPI00343D4838